MAVRQIRVIGDEVLNKKCKPVKEMTPRTAELIEDMFETMYEANGVGLAAPQVGVLKKIVVIDVEDGNQYVLINPEIVEQQGAQTATHDAAYFLPRNGFVQDDGRQQHGDDGRRGGDDTGIDRRGERQPHRKAALVEHRGQHAGKKEEQQVAATHFFVAHGGGEQ